MEITNNFFYSQVSNAKQEPLKGLLLNCGIVFYILETHRLYKTLYDFMKNEVAELTPEEKEKYGVDDYPKD